jgi:3',5'-cyclic AMP phosphodiesterase CpdA
MKSIAHISDLHFGVENRAVADCLLRELTALAPSLVVVSGDLTQRARRKEFEAAAAFLESVSFPKIVVPGNHDIPLYDVARRFISPLKRYQSYISNELNPWFADEEIAVLGLNTARSLTWKSGRISRPQIELIRERFCRLPERQYRILVTHHPFIPPPGEPEAGIDLVGGARDALLVLDECQVDLLLAGHLHHGYTGEVRSFYPATRRSMIVAQAGTAISRRLREQPTAYNQITIDGDQLRISMRAWKGSGFEEIDAICYELIHQEWRRAN